METVYSAFIVLLIILAVVGVLAMFVLFAMVLAVKDGAFLTFGYEQDDNLDKQ